MLLRVNPAPPEIPRVCALRFVFRQVSIGITETLPRVAWDDVRLRSGGVFERELCAPRLCAPKRCVEWREILAELRVHINE